MGVGLRVLVSLVGAILFPAGPSLRGSNYSCQLKAPAEAGIRPPSTPGNRCRAGKRRRLSHITCLRQPPGITGLAHLIRPLQAQACAVLSILGGFQV